MRILTVKRRFLWIFPYSYTTEKPHIRRSNGGLIPCWVCVSEGTTTGFGHTPLQAWHDWANWALL
ncbi:UNVERIFIED_ORG: hypothetical protein ABIC54_004467 [Burkholderia sp. 1263]